MLTIIVAILGLICAYLTRNARNDARTMNALAVSLASATGERDALQSHVDWQRDMIARAIEGIPSVKSANTGRATVRA